MISGKTGAVLVRAPGIAVSMRSGVDMNGDGVSELAVGVPSDSSVKGYGSGAAKIFDPVGQTFLAASYGDTRIDLLGEAGYRIPALRVSWGDARVEASGLISWAMT